MQKMDKKKFSSEEEIINNFESTLNLVDSELDYETIPRILKLDYDIGIDGLPEEYVKRLLKNKNYCFNVLLLGQTGIGKSTLIDSLFRVKFNDDSIRSHSLSKVDVICNYYELQEKDVQLKLGVIESRGFGDQITEDESYKPIVDYVDKQMDIYLEEELRIDRINCYKNDTRIHVCLYLISPVGHGLRSLDLITMKKLDTKVNVIPVIAKSDLITKPDLKELKIKIMSEIEENFINIYRFPTDEPEVSEINTENNSKLPFAIVASNEFVHIGDREVRARQYPWGVVEVENQSHCDFVRLKEMVLNINLEDLRQTTHSKHYEIYRSKRLEKMWEQKQSRNLAEMKFKEKELIKKFTAKLKAKEIELKIMEKELHQRSEQMSRQRMEEKMRLDLEKQRLEEDFRALNRRKQLVLTNKLEIGMKSEPKLSSTPKTKKK